MLRDLPMPTVHSFTAWSVIKEAWGRLGGSKRYYLLLAALVWLIERLIGILTIAFWPVVADGASDGASFGLTTWRTPSLSLTLDTFPVLPEAAGLFPALMAALVATVFAGAFAAFALRRAIGLDVDYGMALRYTRFFSVFLTLQAAAFLLAWITFSIAPLLLLVLAPVSAVVSGFVPLFIVDRDLGPVAAVAAAFRLVRHNLVQSVLLTLITVGTSMLISVTFGIAAIWLAPLMAVTYGIAFRRAVGIHTAGEALPVTATTASDPILEPRA